MRDTEQFQAVDQSNADDSVVSGMAGRALGDSRRARAGRAGQAPDRMAALKEGAVFMAAAALVTLAMSAVAPAQAQSGLPAPQTQSGVEYVTGGFGSDMSDAFKQAQAKYPLAMSFAAADDGASSRPYVADVSVVITAADGSKVLDVPSAGPYLLARPQPGQYTVEATYRGIEQTRKVTIKESGSTQLDFSWDRK